MGPIGDCNDNALIEALWSRMQIELLDTHRWTTRVELGAARGIANQPKRRLRTRSQRRQRTMEHLWSPAVATGGNR